MQKDIDLQAIDCKLNNANVKHLLDLRYKNTLRRQNPYKIVFKDISKLYKQNPITGSLLSETEGEKLTNNG